MKLFKSTNTDTINDYSIYFNFLMPSELVKLEEIDLKVNSSTAVTYCIILVLIR